MRVPLLVIYCDIICVLLIRPHVHAHARIRIRIRISIRTHARMHTHACTRTQAPVGGSRAGTTVDGSNRACDSGGNNVSDVLAREHLICSALRRDTRHHKQLLHASDLIGWAEESVSQWISCGE